MRNKGSATRHKPRGWAGGSGRYGNWIQSWIMSSTTCVTRTNHQLHWRDPTAYATPFKLPLLTVAWPSLTGGVDDVAGRTNSTGTLITFIATCPCGSFCKMTRGTLRLTKRLRDHQMAAESADGCGMPVNMSKYKQNSHTLAKFLNHA